VLITEQNSRDYSGYNGQNLTRTTYSSRFFDEEAEEKEKIQFHLPKF
jgi:hypothetical protein